MNIQRAQKSRGIERNPQPIPSRSWEKVETRTGHNHLWQHLGRISQQQAKQEDPTGAKRRLSRISASGLEELVEMLKRTQIVVAQGQALSWLRAPNHGNQGQVPSQPSIKVSKMRITPIIKIL